MTSEEKQKIIDILNTISSGIDSLPSIEEKRNAYIGKLTTINDVGFFPFKFDPHSEEIEELITNNFLDVSTDGEPKVFRADGYHPWLEAERDNITWNYRDRYIRYLHRERRWPHNTVYNVDKLSDIILNHTENPKSQKLFNVRGLVMGDIQSGKTANYTALINKAIDAGYKIIIILAGLTRELRNQTQNRIDKEVVGRITSGKDTGKKIGVGEYEPNPSVKVEALTCSDDAKEFGDFKKFFNRHVLDEHLNPVIAIVKKNVSVLKNLHSFLSKSDVDCYEDGKLKIPVMIIDDEVDQASVDVRDASTINEASSINKWIRKIIELLSRSAYVGYTATPFANVFINPDKENDLYPKDFILYIPPSKGYCGIKEYFGVDIEDSDDDEADHSTDLFKEIKKAEYLSTFGDVKKTTVDTESIIVPGSLQNALMDYILACSIKKARGIKGYNSMLIHIARFKTPSTTLKPLVENTVLKMWQKLIYDHDNEVEKYKARWEKEFKPVSENRLGDCFNDKWSDIKPFLLKTLDSIKMDRIKVLNGDSDDYLDYSSSEIGDYIVIGGDKLSRGLTLEGLTVSYYWRKSKNYDSLLQMGRWFGYRDGWLDVCRIYTSVEFMNDFITVGKVLEQFKKDLAVMYNEVKNPREVGQRIMYSSNLIPTSRSKMRSVGKLKVSFSNEIQQIISFDRNLIPGNFDFTMKYIGSLGKPTYVSESNKIVYKNISVDKVLEYLNGYKECGSYYEYGQINMKNWIKYIENLNSKDELTKWTIVISSIKTAESKPISICNGKYNIYKRDRTLRDIGDAKSMSHYTVKVITDPTDFKEALDKDSAEYKSTNMYDKSKTYKAFDEKCGLLVIYIFDLHERIGTGEYSSKTNKEKTRRKEEVVQDGVNVCAPAIWFSKTKDYESSAIAYYVTKDYERENPITEEED